MKKLVDLGGERIRTPDRNRHPPPIICGAQFCLTGLAAQGVTNLGISIEPILDDVGFPRHSARIPEPTTAQLFQLALL